FFNGPIDEVRISATPRSLCWIETEYKNESSPGTFDTLGTPTAVTLVSLTAEGAERAVDLSWQTASELDNLGFHVYRSSSEEGPYERITSSVIPGLGSSPVGATYHYRDPGLANGVAYFYKLEDIDTTGRATLHGPVSATPGAGAGEGDGGAPQGG